MKYIQISAPSIKFQDVKKFTPAQAMKAQRGSRGITLFFL